MSDTKPYRPSNGSEGERFMRRFCYRCEHDKEFTDPCEIIMLTMAYDLNDKEYPPEWVRDSSGAKCTNFKPRQTKKEQ